MAPSSVPEYLVASSPKALVTALLGLLGGEAEPGAGSRRANRRLLHLNGLCQRLLTDRMLVVHVEMNADGDHGDGGGDA